MGRAHLISFPVVFIVAFTLTLLVSSCAHRSSVRYENGLRLTVSCVYHPKRSTSYTERGTIVYTDSVTGQLVKKVKYKSKIGCWHFERKKWVLITYDSTGKRIDRENVLRSKRREMRKGLRACDTCTTRIRKVRVHW
jgi:hypothetical protein